jgi:hypothetical protein
MPVIAIVSPLILSKFNHKHKNKPLKPPIKSIFIDLVCLYRQREAIKPNGNKG